MKGKMRQHEAWTTLGVWIPQRAWAEADATDQPELVGFKRDSVHYEFLHHPQAPAAHEIIWPSVVRRETTDGALTIYRVTGRAFR
jgi:hypothetical protein